MTYGAWVHEGTMKKKVSPKTYLKGPGGASIPKSTKATGFVSPFPDGHPDDKRFIFPAQSQALKLPWGTFWYVRGHTPRPFLDKAFKKNRGAILKLFRQEIKRLAKG